ncbi:hypothetical protein LB505_004118 [Fusarium chuoi]|nr:hypothetical protein LB505_004118 [Fusarium chuoi]
MVFSSTLVFLSCTEGVDTTAVLLSWMENYSAFAPKSILPTTGLSTAWKSLPTPPALITP